jgi:hypothetical protein
MTETFKMLNPKGVQAAVITITAHTILVTEDNAIVVSNGVSPIGLLKAVQDYKWEKV